MKLPMVESSGCGTEDCHPLYVACLLRIGDLLDVDSNRVSDVLLCTLTSIPSDSKAYNQTNRDITHITINQSVIELTAECKDYKVAELLNDWFKMINDEITFQTKEWYKIVPNVSFRPLPAVGELTVKLNGYDDITGKDRPRFKIDANKAIEMLQGSGLYSDASQSIRELLQNSVDATYLRIFREQKDCAESIRKFKEYCSKYPMSIAITRGLTDDESAVWHVEIEDQGIGIERDEMKFITQTGSSSLNKKKQSIIDEMPAWMRPSGTFGIGFQSVFLITDEVQMRTRKWGKEETIELTMYNPSGVEKGNVLTKTIVDDNIPFGTKLMFDVRMAHSANWSVNSSERVAIEEISTYDFAVDERMDVTVAKLVDSVIKFASIVDVPIDLRYKEENAHFQPTMLSNRFDFYDEETGMQVSLGHDNGWKSDSCLYFRNQVVDKYCPRIEFIRFGVNLLTEDAKNVLDLSRNDVRPQARSRIRKNMLKSICRYVIQKYNELGQSDENDLRPYAAALLESYRNLLEEEKIECTYPDDWKRLKLKTKEGEKSIEELLSYEKIIFSNSGGESVWCYKKGFDEPDCEISERSGMNRYEILEFFKSRTASTFMGFSFTKNGIVLTRDKCGEMIEEDAYENFYKRYLQVGHYARYLIPCLDCYVNLRVKDSLGEWTFGSFGYRDYPVMVCPYIRQGEKDEDVFFMKHGLAYVVNDKVIDYVYEHRFVEATTREDIVKAYKTYREDVQPIVDKINEDYTKEIKR